MLFIGLNLWASALGKGGIEIINGVLVYNGQPLAFVATSNDKVLRYAND